MNIPKPPIRTFRPKYNISGNVFEYAFTNTDAGLMFWVYVRGKDGKFRYSKKESLKRLKRHIGRVNKFKKHYEFKIDNTEQGPADSNHYL